MNTLSSSEISSSEEVSSKGNQSKKLPVENKADEEHTSVKTPILIFHNGKQKMINEPTRLLFQCSQSNLSSIYALAQANLVQQTQQDIMKMFSTDYTDHMTTKEVELTVSSPKKEIVIVQKPDDFKPKEEQFICDVKGCGRSFSSGGHLKNHQLIHDNEKSLECPYERCGRKFSWPAHLKYHLLTHEKTRSFKCSIENCDKSFVTAQQLKVHSRIHTGEKPFKCDKCDKAFTTAGNLKNHVRTHTGDKPYECPEPKCHLRFAEYSSLKKHSLIHTGEKPFKCTVCGKSFTQSGSMRVHMKKHTQQDTSLKRKPAECTVVINKDVDTIVSDYQVVFSDSSITDTIVTVTTEKQHTSLPVMNEMFLMDDLITKRCCVTSDTTCEANVVVLPLPQYPVAITNYQQIQTCEHEEIVLDENIYLHSDLDHKETACDIQETDH